MSDNCTCKTCGMHYHHCSSCGSDCSWYDEYEYCSKECAEKGSEHLELKKKIVDFIEILTPEQRLVFLDIIEHNEDEMWDIISHDLNGRPGIEAWGYW